MSSSYAAAVEGLHLELSERCNASCPMCGRNNNGGELNPHLDSRDLKLTQTIDWLKRQEFAQLKRIRICGNFGDPAAHPQSLEFCEALKSAFPRAQLQLNTNGSLQKKEYWQKLGRLFRGPGDMLHFALDGLSDTHSIYRRGTNFEKIIENATAAIRGGGNAAWVFLVFEHNEHQVEAAHALAQSLGFRRFTTKYTKRFLRSNRMEIDPEFEVRNRSQQTIYQIRAPRAQRYQNLGLNSLRLRQDSGEKLSDSILGISVDCKAQRERSLYISAEGLVFPCCWVGANLYPSAGESQMFQTLGTPDHKLGLSLYSYELGEILQGDFFARLQDSFLPEAPNRLNVCSRICGRGFETFEEQFEHHTLEAGMDGNTGIIPFH